MFVANTGPARLSVVLELGLNLAKQVPRHDRLMLAFVGFVLVANLANVGDVTEQLVNRVLGEFAGE